MKHLTSYKLKTKLLLAFLLLAFFLAIFIGFSAYNVTYNIVLEQTTASGVEITDRVFSELSAMLYDIGDLFSIVERTQSLQRTMRTQFDSLAETYSMDLQISAELDIISKYKTHIYGVFVIGENGGVYKSNFQTFLNEKFQQTDWYQQIITTPGLTAFPPHEYSLAMYSSANKMVSFGMPFIDVATGSPNGIMLIELEEAEFKDIIERAYSMGTFAVLDKNNNAIIYPDKASLTPTEMNNVFAQASSAGESSSDFEPVELTTSPAQDLTVAINDEYLVIYTDLDWCDWTLASFIPISQLQQSGTSIGENIVLIMIITIIAATFLAYFLSNTITRPLNKLVWLMRRVEQGHLDAKMKVTGHDEISILGNSFNNMLTEINQLMQQIQLDHQKLRKFELDALQAQIAPHFLYNTLDSIVWLARVKKHEKVIQITHALSTLFRLGISKGQDIIMLRDEIEHVKSYLVIQHIRYNDKFTFEINIDDSLLNCYVSKLILQPLVENSIYHGIKNKEGVGKIIITGTSGDDYITLTVSDTGIGMTEEALADLQKNIDTDGPSKSFGLKNVNDRLKIFFGAQYGLRIFSEYGKGTRISIRIPKLYSMDSLKFNL